MNSGNSLYKKLSIKTVREEVKGFKIFTFEEGHNIQYTPGQYLTLVEHQDGEEVRRSYSIASSPAMNEPLTIGVKRIDNGFFSRRLADHAKEGDEIITTGSGGLFILPHDITNYHQLFFFAAGSGITPIYSLIKTALFALQHLSVILVYSNHTSTATVFLTELKELQQLFPQRFYVQWLFSNSPDLSKARLHRDLIIELLHQLAKDRSKMLFYICGPESYMRLCTYTLQEHGIHPDNIKRENFIIHTVPKQDLLPPDKNDRVVNIHIGNLFYMVHVRYPDSILKAAKKEGLSLPYSCEAGRCGNCVARCIKGKVWHSYNEVLTEKELQKGLVLTCVGHPQGGDVELEI